MRFEVFPPNCKTQPFFCSIIEIRVQLLKNIGFLKKIYLYRRLIGECKNGANCIITKNAKDQAKFDKRKSESLKQINLWSNNLENVTDEHEETEKENEEFHCQTCGETYHSKDNMDIHKQSQEHLEKLKREGKFL